jgi:glutathionyl-hydroquinone reductase
MGEMIRGKWQQAELDTHKTDGIFRRKESVFRNWVTADGSAGPSGAGGFRAEPGRYHLYVSLACPWAHRTLIMRNLKGLRAMIGVSVVNWLMLDDGWTFEPGEGVVPDTVNGVSRLRDLYLLADLECTSRVTVPVLWDKERRTIVNNESSEIIRMFNSAFDRVGAAAGDYYPQPLRLEIDQVNARIYDTLNNGVYKAGFTTRQDAYETTVSKLFETLDWLEQRLSRRRFICGELLTEADIRLFTTLVRFDPVYFGHFKCNLRALVDYPDLWAYTRDLYQHEAIRPTVNFGHIKRHYYMSHRAINPSGVVPVGPERDFDQPSGRANLDAAE